MKSYKKYICELLDICKERDIVLSYSIDNQDSNFYADNIKYTIVAKLYSLECLIIFRSKKHIHMYLEKSYSRREIDRINIGTITPRYFIRDAISKMFPTYLERHEFMKMTDKL